MLISSFTDDIKYGCVSSNLQQNEYGTSFEDKKNHVKVYTDEPNVKYGQCYALNDVSLITNKYQNEASFDYVNYMKSKSILYTANAEQLITTKNNLIVKIKNLRIKLINRNCINYSDTCSYINALVFGDKGIDNNFKNIYGKIGIAPLFVISGMHLSYLSKKLFSLSARLKILDVIAKPVILVVLGVYTILANMQVGIIRAYIMTLLSSIFNINSANSLVITIIITVIINPYVILNRGYVLSYGITFAIIEINKRVKLTDKWRNVKFCFYIYLISFPLAYGYNYTFNIFAIINMLIFGPLILFVMLPLSFIMTVLNIKILAFFLNAMVFLVNTMSSALNIFTVSSGHISVVMWCSYGLITFLIFKKIKYAIYVLSLWFLFICLDLTLYPTVTFIDVGQGDSAVIELLNKNILIDVGNNANELISELNYLGVTNIDTVIISHAHLDHYGALEQLSIEKKIANVIELKDNQISANSYPLADVYEDDNVLIIPYYGSNSNDRELVVKFDFGIASVLFAGDVELESEQYLTSNYCLKINSDIIKVPHHGSKTSSSDPFLNCVSPQIAVISSGKNNMYNHPNDQIVRKYEKRGKVYNTQTDGDIEIKFKQNKVIIK